MIKISVPIVLAVLCGGLLGCSPPGVPSGAAVHWELKSDFYWTWNRRFEQGCADWMAKDAWASVQLVVDSRCEEGRTHRFLTERGVTYFSAEDHLTFKGYWPWSDRDYFDLIEFDSEGMISEIRPCPHSLSPEHIAALQALARQAHTQATTDRERSVMRRVVERLAVVSGESLASGQGGCTDMPPDWHNSSVARQDPWAR